MACGPCVARLEITIHPQLTGCGPVGSAPTDLHGRPICLFMHAERRPGGPPVTRSGLARIPVERLVLRAAVEAGGLRAESLGDGVIAFEPLTGAEQAKLARQLRPPLDWGPA